MNGGDKGGEYGIRSSHLQKGIVCFFFPVDIPFISFSSLSDLSKNSGIYIA
jgi:hypothetical protein